MIFWYVQKRKYYIYFNAYGGEATAYVRSAQGQAQAQVIKDYINEELAADFLGYLANMDQNSKEFKKFAGENRNLIQRILDAITGFIRKLKKENANADVKQYEKTVQMLRDILNKNISANTEIKDVNENAGGRVINNNSEDVRKSKDVGEGTLQHFQSEYESNVDKVLNNTYNSSNPLIVGKTPSVLQDIGLAALPVTITPSHVYSIAKTENEAKAEGRYSNRKNYHGLGSAAVKGIMEKISDPIMIILAPDTGNSSAKPNQRYSAHRLIAVVDFNINGRQVIAPIEVDAEVSIDNTRIDSNHVVSYYDRSSISSLIGEVIAQENTGGEAIYYGNKKRIEDFVKQLGLQLPARFKNISDSDTIIRNVSENVNRKIESVTQSQQFKRWFGDWQNDPANASKVVNNTPKGIVVSKVRTVHARSDFSKQITDESVLYLKNNKKETNAWFQSRGIDVPLRGTQLGVIRSIDFNYSIADSDGNVNTSEDNSDIRNAKDVADVRSTEEKLREENDYLKRQFVDQIGDKWTEALIDHPYPKEMQ